jgi:hypothetical protein
MNRVTSYIRSSGCAYQCAESLSPLLLLAPPCLLAPAAPAARSTRTIIAPTRTTKRRAGRRDRGALRVSPPLFHSGQRSVDKYLRPLSHTITATVPPLHAPRGPSSCNAADTFAPAENPPNIPSSAARRREHSTASWSFTYKEGESVHSVRTRVVRCYGVNEVRSKAARGGKNLY